MQGGTLWTTVPWLPRGPGASSPWRVGRGAGLGDEDLGSHGSLTMSFVPAPAFRQARQLCCHFTEKTTKGQDLSSSTCCSRSLWRGGSWGRLLNSDSYRDLRSLPGGPLPLPILLPHLRQFDLKLSPSKADLPCCWFSLFFTTTRLTPSRALENNGRKSS